MYSLGLSFLGGVVVLWVLSGFLVARIGATYDKPFFLTYINTSFMVLYLLFAKWHDTRRTAQLAGQFALLWFASNFFNNASYFYTSVPSATIIACTSSFWTLCVGHWFGIDKFSVRKLGMLLLSLGGVVVITIQDEQDEGKQPLLGNLLALFGAMTYGLYTCLLKYRVGEDKIDTKQFMGLVGLFSFIGLWPVILVLHWTGLETFEVPRSATVKIILLNGMVSMSSDLLWVLATLMTSPLIVSVGLSGTIPLSVLCQVMLTGRTNSWLYYVGAAGVLVGFVDLAKNDI